MGPVAGQAGSDCAAVAEMWAVGAAATGAATAAAVAGGVSGEAWGAVVSGRADGASILPQISGVLQRRPGEASRNKCGGWDGSWHSSGSGGGHRGGNGVRRVWYVLDGGTGGRGGSLQLRGVRCFQGCDERLKVRLASLKSSLPRGVGGRGLSSAGLALTSMAPTRQQC